MQKWSRCNLIGEVAMKIKCFFLKQIQGKDALNKCNGYIVLDLQRKRPHACYNWRFCECAFFAWRLLFANQKCQWKWCELTRYISVPCSLLRWWLGKYIFMFHCEPQYNEILLAALMVTADVFQTQSYKEHLTSCSALQCHQRAPWYHLSWPGDLYDGHPWAWLGIVLS